MGDRKQFHPFWYVIFDLTHREFIKNLFRIRSHLLFEAVHSLPRVPLPDIFLPVLFTSFCASSPYGLFRIHKNQKWFFPVFEFLYCLFFSIHKIFTWNITEGTVAGYYKTDSRMFLDCFSGSDLCRLMKRNLLFIPGVLPFVLFPAPYPL